MFYSKLNHTALSDWTTVCNKLELMRKEAIEVLFEVLSQNVPLGSEANHKSILVSQSATWLGFKPVRALIKVSSLID
jgi:hypothetical protein